MANPTERIWLEIELVSIMVSWDWPCPLSSERLRLFFVQSYVAFLIVRFTAWPVFFTVFFLALPVSLAAFWVARPG
jgi:hypothetical protein